MVDFQHHIKNMHVKEEICDESVTEDKHADSKLFDDSRCKTQLGCLQQLMGVGITRGYRTISYEAGTVLARSPPSNILADMDTMVYDQIRSVGRNDEETEPDHKLECYGGMHTRKP